MGFSNETVFLKMWSVNILLIIFLSGCDGGKLSKLLPTTHSMRLSNVISRYIKTTVFPDASGDINLAFVEIDISDIRVSKEIAWIMQDVISGSDKIVAYSTMDSDNVFEAVHTFNSTNYIVLFQQTVSTYNQFCL